VVADHSFAVLDSNQRPLHGIIQRSIRAIVVDATLWTIFEGQSITTPRLIDVEKFGMLSQIVPGIFSP
jgi:hypothetical protein